MITTQLTKLTANDGMVITDGVNFSKSVLLMEGEEPSKYYEITEEYYHKLIAQMTPREFLLALINKGKTRKQIEEIINSDDRVWAELTGATVIVRANPLLDQLCSRLGLTSADLDEMFGLTPQLDNIEESEEL